MARPAPTAPNLLERRLAAEQQTLAQPLRSLLRRAPIVCGETQTVHAAVQRMHQEAVGAIIVVDGRDRPIGILTERDLLEVTLHRKLDVPIAEVMTREPLSLPDHTPSYEAALLMIEHRIRHVLVTAEERLIGVVSERDLFSLQRLGLGELTMEIRLAVDVDALAALATRVRQLTRMLVEQGVAAERLTLFVSVLNDRISERVIEIVRKRHHWDRIGWCWLAFGSEGRLEQTFATDQDNGLIFVAHDAAASQQVRALLLPFAREVNEALDACGYPLCDGNVMASNPELCLSMQEWQLKLKRWLENSEPKALLDAAICFDFRPLCGDARLAAELRQWFLGVTRKRQNFLRLLAENALQAKPPLGRWRDFVTEDAPTLPGTINLKMYGVRPFVDAARVYSLAHGLPQTSTADRLRAASAASVLPAAEAQAMLAAFFVIQRIRLAHQATFESAFPAGDGANRIDPKNLNELDRRTLKEAFKISRSLQSRLAMDYHL
jgi:CBS domain-containing protein